MLDISLKKTFGNFSIDLSFNAPDAGITALFGRSGSGKTSLINMVAGLVKPDRGRVTVAGDCVFDSKKGINMLPEKRGFGYVFQDGRLFSHMTVKKNLTYGQKRIRKKNRCVSFDQVVELLGISHLLDRCPANLSGGEKQRVAIGRALLTNPKLLLMDEPLASLDAMRKAEVIPFIAKLSTAFSIPILYVSHSMDEIVNLADSLVFLKNGRCMAAGDIESVSSDISFQRLAGPESAGTVISTVIKTHDPAAGITFLGFKGGEFIVPRLDLGIGTPVRVRIPSRHVALATDRPTSTSFQNIFKGTIRDVAFRDHTFVDVTIDAGALLIATITCNACASLHLKPGKPVYALIKSVSIAMGDIGKSPPGEADYFL